MLIIRPPHAGERDLLHAVWERSVRATHSFLTEEDISYYSPMVRQVLDTDMEFWAACDNASNIPVGFLALDQSPENEWKLEALFVDPDRSRRGAGTLLLRHALLLKGYLLLDVNEQNPGARAFYERLGFRATGRSPFDGMGRPFPLIHMEGGGYSPLSPVVSS